MSEWNELVGRVTRRLDIDEELRLDVARELQCHLEDCAAEFRSAGQTDEQAAASAARALGDADELAEQLWQANRGRIRLRGVLRWAARVTLLPVAAAIVLALIMYVVNVGSALVPGKYGYRGWYPAGWNGKVAWPMGPVGEFILDPYRGMGLSQEQRFLLWGDPDGKTPVERQKSIADRWPDNPVYYGNYVTNLLNGGGKYYTWKRDGEIDTEKLSAVIAALRKGEQLDPSNAFYTLEIAALLVRASTKLIEDPNRTYQEISLASTRAAPACSIEITDSEMFQQGVEEFHRGLGRPQFTSHTLNMLRLRLAALPAPTRLVQYLARLDMSFSTMLPPSQDFIYLGKAVLGRAMELGKEGRGDQAIQLTQDVELMGDKIGGQSDTFLLQLFVGAKIRSMAMGHAELIYTDMGQIDQAAQERRRQQTDAELYRHVWAGDRLTDGELAGMGLLERMTVPSLPGYRAEMLKPLRQAEWFIAAQAGLLLLLGVLLLAALCMAARTGLELAILPRERRPVLLFVGWRRLGRICLLAVMVPIAAYGVYAIAAAQWGPSVGLSGAWNRIAMELLLVTATVFVLLVRMSGAAVRRRAAEVGMELPPPMTRRQQVLPAVFLALGTVPTLIGIIGWCVGGMRAGHLGEGATSEMRAIVYPVFGACTLVPLGIAWALWAPARGTAFKRYRRSVRRSTVPILAAAVIVVAVVLGAALAAGEGYAVRKMGRGMPMPDEIRDSDLHLVREHLACEEQQLAAEMRAASGAPAGN